MKPVILNSKDYLFDQSSVGYILKPSSNVIKCQDAFGVSYHFVANNITWKLRTTEGKNSFTVSVADSGDNSDEKINSSLHKFITNIKSYYDDFPMMRFEYELDSTYNILTVSLYELDAPLFKKSDKNSEKTEEHCPFCDEVVELDPELKVQRCPKCGKHIVTCSMCIAVCDELMGEVGLKAVDCSNCVLCKQAEYLNLTKD